MGASWGISIRRNFEGPWPLGGKGQENLGAKRKKDFLATPYLFEKSAFQAQRLAAYRQNSSANERTKMKESRT